MIWKAKIHDEELVNCGFTTASDDHKWGILLGLMRAKGLPDDIVLNPGDMNMTPVEDGVEVEFK